MPEPILRIYADFAVLVRGVRDPRRTGVVLDTIGSLRDLANAGYRLIDGLPLIATDGAGAHQDVEGRGAARYDRARQCWIVEFDAAGVRHVPAVARTRTGAFACSFCESAIPVRVEAAIVRPADACPTCRAPLAAFFAPPKMGTENISD